MDAKGAWWRWDDIFEMEVPPRWQVTQTNDVVEVQPDRPVGAAHISLLRRRTEGRIQEGEARSIIRGFADEQGVREVVVSERDDLGGVSADAHFETMKNGIHLYWHVEVHVSTAQAILCSYCHDGMDRERLDLALAMLQSIRLLGIKRN